ncbi:Ppx/GppA family phosphatase [Ideonella sp. B7]|uniref:Ppx/GppA phosphatase family protein n=1 Tax=Ideonella benzenivorans TaxID=2831643 RepID=UPI001CED2147|nr:Ppx/GppA phosphatase family protein [Ideonella benzenivorans]MCA6216588.1 Ppx/GppA family phosphatase [Ideonella benzenivorans]
MPIALPSPTGLLAGIDMGSNSFRLEIGHLRDGRYRRHAYLKETVRLGAGLDSEGMLTADAAERGLTCLRQFGRNLGGFHPLQVRAVATQTLREARNRDAFLHQAQAALGFPIEVISGREEARLIYAGVAHLQPSSQPRLVVDIGGRSTELILGLKRQPLEAESFRVGSVSLSMRYFPDGRFTAEGFRAAQIAAGAEFEEALAPFEPSRWDHALGSSGTAGAVSDVLQACGETDGSITPDGLRWLMKQCIEAGSADRLDLPGLKPDRRPVLAGGLAILYTLATHFDIAALRPAKGALRQGVIVDLHDRLLARQRQHGGDLREDSVKVLQQRFGADPEQAQRVAQLATTLFRMVVPQDSGEDELTELRWAALLHEIGQMVSHHDHHRHSAYLLGHVDAAGFSQSQQRRLADLVLGQRGGLRKLEAQVSSELMLWQLLCLRLAVIGCHARTDVPAAALKLQRQGRIARLVLKKDWAEAHPRTVHLLEEEESAWGRSELPLTLHIA